MTLSKNEFIEKQHNLTIGKQARKNHGYLVEGVYTEGDMALKTNYRYALPNKRRIEVFLPDGGSYTEGYDGKQAWELTEIVFGRKDAALRHGGEWPNPLKSIKDFLERGNSGDYLGVEEYREKNYHKMKLIQKDGFERYYYIDLETFLIRYGLDVRPLHPQENKKYIETEFTNYQEIDGVKFPMISYERDLDKNEILTSIKWDKMYLNPKFDGDTFEKLKD